MDRDVESLKKNDLLKALDDEVLQQFLGCADTQSFSAGDVILREFMEGDEVYLILSGNAKVEMMLANADQDLEVFTAEAGDLLGVVRFFGTAVPGGSAIATSDVETLVWSARSWRDICGEQKEIGYYLAMGIGKLVIERLRNWSAGILDNVSWGLDM